MNSATVIDSIAQALSRLGDHTRGVILTSVAVSIRERANARLTAIEQASRDETTRICRAALDQAAFAAAWEQGRTLSLIQAIALIERTT